MKSRSPVATAWTPTDSAPYASLPGGALTRSATSFCTRNTTRRGRGGNERLVEQWRRDVVGDVAGDEGVGAAEGSASRHRAHRRRPVRALGNCCRSLAARSRSFSMATTRPARSSSAAVSPPGPGPISSTVSSRVAPTASAMRARMPGIGEEVLAEAACAERPRSEPHDEQGAVVGGLRRSRRRLRRGRRPGSPPPAGSVGSPAPRGAARRRSAPPPHWWRPPGRRSRGRAGRPAGPTAICRASLTPCTASPTGGLVASSRSGSPSRGMRNACG